MEIDSRQDAILGLLRAQDHVAVDDLATHFRVSIQTIRSDLRDLSSPACLSAPEAARAGSYPRQIATMASDAS